jgi:hypothetical protein
MTIIGWMPPEEQEMMIQKITFYQQIVEQNQSEANQRTQKALNDLKFMLQQEKNMEELD